LVDLFPGFDASLKETSIDEIVTEEKELAKGELIKMLWEQSVTFEQVWTSILEAHMLRVTNVKDICVELAREGKIRGAGNRKPQDQNVIQLAP
jgi:hypothetical protein